MDKAPALIAVVDDEVSVRTMMRRALRLGGYEVEAFASGQQFLDALAAHSPDCAVLDIHMPGLSGLDVVTSLNAGATPIPCILITASDSPDLDAQSRALGATCLLRKPFSIQALFDAVQAAITRRDPGRI